MVFSLCCYFAHLYNDNKVFSILYINKCIEIHLIFLVNIFFSSENSDELRFFNSEALDKIRPLHDVTELVISFSTQVKIMCLKDKFARKWKFSHYLLTTVQCRWKSGEVLVVHKTFLEEKLSLQRYPK